MVVDASVLCAILLQETDADAFGRRIDAESNLTTHPVSVWETVAALSRETDLSVVEATGTITDFLAATGIKLVVIGSGEMMAAIEAFARFGRGRHPAKLNMGDCFSYACAKLRGVQLLYKGDDFAQTDLA